MGIGTSDPTVTFSPFELMFESKTLKGSVYGESHLRRDVDRLTTLWRTGRLDLDALVTRRIRFEQLNDAVAALRKGEAVRQVVLFD